MIYQTLNFTIDTVALTLHDESNMPITIRAKTCKLLIFLLENQGQAQSKETLLEHVWSDSVVSEQVIFQSINEIRKLFSGIDVIKTIPKKGYVWLPEVSLQEQTKASSLTKYDSKTIIFTCLMCVILLGFVFLQKDDVNEGISGSVIVLPSINEIQGNDHNWVRFGMMDQVIQRLPNSDDYAVLQTDYVLEVMKRANAPFKYIDESQIESLFLVSGAELIITSKLSGTPFDYQLNYRFYTRDSVKQGVILDANIQTIIDELSALVTSKLGQENTKSTFNFHDNFKNELLARAIELRLSRNFEAAQPLLQSLVQSEPDNVTARRLLSSNSLIINDLENADFQLNTATRLAKEQNDKFELAKLLLAKAYRFNRDDLPDQAQELALQAVEIAKQNKDWLYMAHAKSFLARLALNNQDYTTATQLFEQAKAHHNTLRCPVGESIAWINLAEVAKQQNQIENFQTALSKAKILAESRALTRQLKRINEMEISF